MRVQKPVIIPHPRTRLPQPPFEQRAEIKQLPEVQASGAHRTPLWLHEPVNESHSIKGFYLRCIGRRRNGAADGSIVCLHASRSEC